MLFLFLRSCAFYFKKSTFVGLGCLKCARIWIGPLRSSTSLLYLATEFSPKSKLFGDGDARALCHVLIGPGGATFSTFKSKVCAQPATADKKKSFPDKPFPDIAFFELSLCNKRHASRLCVAS